MHYKKKLLCVLLTFSFIRIYGQAPDNASLYVVYLKPYQQQAAFINSRGKVMFRLDKKYALQERGSEEMTSHFKKGMCLVYDKDYNYYAINKQGKVIHRFGKTRASHISGNVIHVSKGKSEALMDLNFNLLTDFKYYSIEDFSEGLFVATTLTGQLVFLDAGGKETVKTSFKAKTSITGGGVYNAKFNEGLVRFAQGDKIGYLSREGKIAVAPIYSYAYDFSDGLARVCLPEKGCGYINAKGEWVIKPLNGDVHKGSYSSGLIGKLNKKTGKYGYVNRDDQWVIKPNFSSVEPFVNGLAVVSKSSRESNRSKYLSTSRQKGLPHKEIINPKGKAVWKGYFHFAQLANPNVIFLAKGGAFASAYKNTNNYAYYSRKFKKIYEPSCDQKVIQDLQTLRACSRKKIRRISMSNTKNPVNQKQAIKYLKGTNPVSLRLGTTPSLKNIPDMVYEMSNLQELDLSFEDIGQIPQKIERLQNLKKLNLEYNKLTRLPEAIFKLKNLKELNISNNNFKIKEVVSIRKKLPDVKVTFSIGGFTGGEVVGNLNLIPYRKGNLWGYCDSTKKIVIKPQFKEVGFFEVDGDMVYAKGNINGKSILIFQDGSYIENEESMYIIGGMDFSTGSYFSSVKTDSSLIFGKKHGFRYMTSESKVLFSPVYESCTNIFRIRDKGEFYGMLTLKNSKKTGIVDTKGNIILPFEYSKLEMIDRKKQIMLAKKDGRYGLIKFNGKIIYPFELGHLERPQYQLLLAKKDDRYGFINIKGKEIIPFKYFRAESFGESPTIGPYAKVYLNDYLFFYIDTKGLEYYD